MMTKENPLFDGSDTTTQCEPVDPNHSPGGKVPATVLLEALKTPARRRSKKPSIWQQAARQLTRDDVPEYLREAYGPFITGHFRAELSFGAACVSLFTLHNETANIWSHLLGFLLMVALLIVFLAEKAPQMHYTESRESQSSLDSAPCPAAPKWPHVLFIAGAMYVMAISTMVHLLCCMGRKVYFQVWKYDYTAIAVVMWTMYVPWCWYIFDCNSPAVKFVYVITSGILAAACVAVGLVDKFQDPKYHAFQPLSFSLLGMTGLAPMIHACVWFWASSVPVRHAFALTVLQLVCNAIGAMLFSTRLPERWLPGRVNLIGHSHFIMHLLVVAAFVSYYFAGKLLWKWRSEIGGCMYGCTSA